MPISQKEMDAFFHDIHHKHQSSPHWYQCHDSLSAKNRDEFESSSQDPSIILDLHGKSSDEAYRSCIDIIAFAQNHEHRIIKIIHGIGTQTLKKELQQHIRLSKSMLLITNKHHNKISRSCFWIWLKKSFDF